MCPACFLARYRVQGLSLEFAVPDMMVVPRRAKRGRSASNNVPLGRLETPEGVYLLRIVGMNGLLYRPDPRPLAGIKQLRQLEKETSSRWGGRPTLQSF